MLLQQKAAEAENEVQRIKLSVMESEEEKMMMKAKVHESEQMVQRLMEDAERRKQESDDLKKEVHSAREEERRAKEKLIEYISTSTSLNPTTTVASSAMPPDLSNGFAVIEPDSPPPLNLNTTASTTATTNGGTTHLDATQNQISFHNHTSLMADSADLSQLSLEIENVRHEYHKESRNLQEQLEAFRSEIDELRVDDKVTPLDNLHREQITQGDNKYQTIQKVKRGSTSSRITFFEEL